MRLIEQHGKITKYGTIATITSDGYHYHIEIVRKKQLVACFDQLKEFYFCPNGMKWDLWLDSGVFIAVDCIKWLTDKQKPKCVITKPEPIKEEKHKEDDTVFTATIRKMDKVKK